MNPGPANSPSSIPPSARTPLSHWHEQIGARIGERDGWQVAEVFTGVDQEVAAARKNLAIADISAFAKVNLLGAGVADLTRTLAGNSRAEQPRGVAALPADPSLLACRLKQDQLLVMALTTDRSGVDGLIGPGPGESVIQHDMTSAYAAIWLIGPNSDLALRQMTHHDVASMPVGSCAETGLAAVPAILIRPPKLSVPSVQVLVPWDVAEYVWETFVDSSRKRNIAPLGMEALDALLQEEGNKGKLVG